MDISAVSNMLQNSLSSAEATKSDQEADSFELMLQKAIDNKNDEELKEACGEYESYFINKIFSQMRKSIPKSDLIEPTEGHDIYEDMLYEAYSKEMSAGKGIGIKEALYNQLKKNV